MSQELPSSHSNSKRERGGGAGGGVHKRTGPRVSEMRLILVMIIDLVTKYDSVMSDV